MARILLVEDDPFISEIYKKKFESSGFAVTVAASGQEVLKVVGQGSFDLILLDLVLPEMSGIEILRELRKKNAPAAGTRIIVLSNLSGEEDRAEARKAGADGFLSKTEFTPSELVEEVKRLLPGASPTDQKN